MKFAHRRRWPARCLSAGLVVTSMLLAGPQALAAGSSLMVAHDDPYGDLGYYSDYGGYYDPYSSFTYDAGNTCYGGSCDGGFYDPSSSFVYDEQVINANNQAATDASSAAFDEYISEGAPPPSASGLSWNAASPASFKAVGRMLNTLTATTRAGGPASAAPILSRPLSIGRLSGIPVLPLQAGRPVAGGGLESARGTFLTSGFAGAARSTGGPLLLARAPGFAARSGAAAARVSVFVDTQRTYKIDYPGDWIMTEHDQYVRGAYVDARLFAPDGNAGLVGQSATLPAGMTLNLNDPSVQNYLASSLQFSAFGARPTAQADLQAFTIPSGDTVLVGRVPFQWVDSSLFPPQFPNLQPGMQGAVMFVALHNNNRLYIVTGTIGDLSTDTALNDAQQLSAIFSSLDLVHYYTPTGKPNAIVDATKTYRLLFPHDTWGYTKGVPRGDTALVSHDHTSAVVALTSPAPKGMQQISSGYMHQVVASLGSTLGAVTKAPVFHKIASKGGTRYAATLPFRRADGKTGKALIVATLHQAKVCAVVGIAMDHGGSQGIRQQAQQASYIVSSLHLM